LKLLFKGLLKVAWPMIASLRGLHFSLYEVLVNKYFNGYAGMVRYVVKSLYQLYLGSRNVGSDIF